MKKFAGDAWKEGGGNLLEVAEGKCLPSGRRCGLMEGREVE